MNRVLKKYDAFLDVWSKATKKKRIGMFLAAYTVAFLVTFLLAYSPFLAEGKTFIWSGDGVTINYPALIYVGRYWRAAFLNLLHGKFAIPMFDLNLGLGGDVIGILNWYGFGDPLTLLSVFVPTRYTEYLYNFLIVLRLYFAGLAFCALCRYHKKRMMFALIGSIVYAFCGFAIFCSVRHPFFLNPMIQLPLILLGVDKVIKKERPYIFIGAIAYSALCGFYFLYMMTLMTGVYVLVRFFELYRENRAREFGGLVGRGVGAYLLGLGVVGVIFIPSVVAFLFSSRLGVSATQNLFSYGWRTYLSNLLKTITPPGGGTGDVLAMAAVALPAIILLIAHRKKKRTLFVLFLTAFVCFSLPLGGFIMNGFGYISQRWTFGFALLVAYVTVEMLPELLECGGRTRTLCFVVLIAYSVITLSSVKTRGAVYLVGVAMLACTVAVLFYSSNEAAFVAQKRLAVLLCLCLVIANVSVNTVYHYAKDQMNYISNFAKLGVQTENIENVVERKAESYLTDLDGRFDGSRFVNNRGLVWHIPTMSAYWSVLPMRPVLEFLERTENAGLAALHHITDIDYRTFTETLLSGKYFIETEDRTQYVPFGYERVKRDEGGDGDIYENRYALPWGYTYEKVLPYEDLEGLNGLETEEAMLEGIALEGGVETFPRAKMETTSRAIPYEVTLSKNIKWDNGSLTVGKAGETITLTYKAPKETEIYVRLKGFLQEEKSPSEFKINIMSGGRAKQRLVLSKKHPYYFGTENYLFYLGSGKGEPATCTITIPAKGTYKLENIELYVQPMDNYAKRVEALRAEPLENIEWDTNRLSGTVDLSQDKVLCVSVPYSTGWTATVDGRRTDILRGNYMFMALPLEAGYHEIEFTYCTPGLKLGVIVMAGSAIVLLFVIRRERKNGV